MKAVVVFAVVLIVLSLAAFSPPTPACPDPTPTPPTSVDFTNFSARFVAPGMLKLQVQSVMEISLIAVQFTTRNGVPIGQEMPACYPGMPLSCGYVQFITGPSSSAKPCFGLRYLENDGYWHTFNPGSAGCVQ